MSRKRQSRGKRRNGVTLVLLSLLLPVMVLLAAFAINLAYMELCRTELFIAADAAARAGGRELAISGDTSAAITAAAAAADRNHVAGKSVSLDASHIQFGESTRNAINERYTFATGGAIPNALEVTVRRDGSSPDGPIRLLMPNLLGISSFTAAATSRSTQVEVDIAIVLDRSGSMAYAADEPAIYPPVPASVPAGWDFCQPAPPASRWRDAVLAVDVFLNALSSSTTDERVALVTYNTNGVVDTELTGDYDEIRVGMDAYTQSFCSGSTNIASGISGGLASLGGSGARPWASKVIVVMTDGIQTASGDPVGEAFQAADQGVMIFAVTFSQEADQSTMQDVAYAGLGKHFHATSGTDLVNVFREIARAIPTLLTK